MDSQSVHQAYAWVRADDLEKYGDTIEKEIKQAIILAAARWYS